MSLLRSTTLRVASRLHPLRNAVQVQGRTYASARDLPAKMNTSNVPWMAAAAVGTAGGLYLVTKQDTSHTDSKQAKAQHANVGEITYKNEGNTTPSKADDDFAPGTQNGKSGEKLGQKKIEEKPDSSQPGAGRPDPDEEGGLVGHAPRDSKKSGDAGAVTPDLYDKPDPRGKPTSINHMSGKQEGLSNADTHHTSQVSHQPEKSKKGEGVAETAKLKGTVSTDRPGPENKEERGKARMDKNA
ncbi:hypothetical protein COCC4DRAFT_136577 [Bipolaris maydis ATCC 48331]|uniref:Uncharacterized protein n=1 Tax=Cochliobolus heterostrophus (strain C4 / ATCC 48331 / race T) TaxID=665024 RepID=N4X267_COCH4|nr:uncharacterized protein COCC4DRAFT_136577 [Bipolaris maydis ATCC 48331]ENI05795.1 hypothetical protein COCC4DRAFT_136577 [Bipolaris maydis ATCC 48331]